jgi:hypothetical protein
LTTSQALAVLTVMLAGQVMVGFSVSLMVTVNMQLAVKFTASVAVQDTVVVPLGKLEPDGGVQTKLSPGQLSVTVGAKVTTVAHWPGAVDIVMLAGQVIVGGCVSLMVTVKVQGVAALPLASLTLQVTVVVPFGKAVPAAGVQTGVPTAGQLSVAVAFG